MAPTGKKISSRSFIRLATTATIVVFMAMWSGLASARVENVPGFIVSDRIYANEGVVVYNFTGNNVYSFSTNVDVQLTLSIGAPLRFQRVNMTINSTTSLSLFMQNLEFSTYPWSSWFELDDDHDGITTMFNQTWGSFLFFGFNKTGANITLFMPIGPAYNISTTDKLTINKNGTWNIIPTTVINDQWLRGSFIVQQYTNFLSVFASNESSTDPDEPPGPVEPPVDPPVDDYEALVLRQQAVSLTFVTLGALLGVIIALATLISFTGKEYRDMIKGKASRDIDTRHTLTIEDVLENENRVLIIDEILKEPGIHFNELMRRTSLAPGNLVWHLEILCDYKVIGKKSVGQYVVYYPLSPANPLHDVDITIVKSKVTLQVLNMIEDEPGIYGNILAKRLGLDHKTIKYHVDKLVEAKLITAEKDGRRRKLAPRLPTSIDNPKMTRAGLP